MRRDIRDTALYREAAQIYETVRQAGTGQICDAAEVHVSPEGTCAIFTGVMLERPEGASPSRICQIDLSSGDVRVLTFGPNVDRAAKYAPDGRTVAFLSDRRSPGDFQLYVLDLATGAARATPAVEGWVEYLHWSPDGRRILLGVAGYGADLAGAQGGVATRQRPGGFPSWMPEVETGNESYRWRRAWVYDIGADSIRQIQCPDLNLWEATWCGNDSIAAIASSSPAEATWYRAALCIIEVENGNARELYASAVQLGWLTCSPSGDRVAVVEALCSDRILVAGDLRIIDTRSAKVERVNTNGVDITCTDWRSDDFLLVAGHRGTESAVGFVEGGGFTQTWSSSEITTGGAYITIAGLGRGGDCTLVGEGYQRAPEISMIRAGRYRPVKSFDLGYAPLAEPISAAEPIAWTAPDGLQIQGWLLRPKEPGPRPLVMYVHGGPIWHWRPMWLGRAGAAVLMLLRRGYAVFFPNPRGSSGRGQDFARRVLGDMGGADSTDDLSGLDYLVAQGIADRGRLGVIGASYGGFMVAWLISHDGRFAAAVSVAPMINYVTQHLLSNIPSFDTLFLEDVYQNPNGEYFQRSPIMHAHKVMTPTLNVVGALDRSAPPEEAVQFHRALLEKGVKSVLLSYPEEGHGVRRLPAAADYAARVVSWFETHLNAKDEA